MAWAFARGGVENYRQACCFLPALAVVSLDASRLRERLRERERERRSFLTPLAAGERERRSSFLPPPATERSYASRLPLSERSR